ncbi:MAG: thioredoxin family protein [Bacilli bacterium]|nr:thioredoxin family protein [Bacilli bacterium]MDD3120794.1 thioredoxin family protein [Bacilli bacterium]MDD4062989.1 thioredoxin family protein [Bacilli bacterium]MDD4481731.1 thioredoxin family protein [Bacilli bacterium]MDY0363780.1 thioredoxin family protein [Bacilli bacterium]
MEKLFNNEVEKQLKEVLSHMIKPITIIMFSNEDCLTCKETKQLLNEVVSLNNKISLEIKEIKNSKNEVEKYNIKLVPSFVLLDENKQYKGVKFNGIPAGHEINSFISAVLEMSGIQAGFNEDLITRIKKISKPVNIKVFITLACPHCPGAVQTAHRLAMLNKNITAEMIEAQTFSDESVKYNVSGVPKIIINENKELVGNHPIENFLEQIESI